MIEESPPHATLVKFGYPARLVARHARWAVLLRPVQVTLGSLVLVCREPATAFADISVEAFTELKAVTTRLERALTAAFAFDRLNYLMLRMVDPHVHFHVLPRYAEPRRFAGVEFVDTAWPKAPDLSRGSAPEPPVDEALLALLRAKFEAVAA